MLDREIKAHMHEGVLLFGHAAHCMLLQSMHCPFSGSFNEHGPSNDDIDLV